MSVSQRRRIALVGQAHFSEMPGGAARHLSGLADELRREGHAVHVFTAARLQPSHGRLGSGPLGRVVRAVARLLLVVPAAMLAVIRHRPDVINVHFPPDSLGAVLAAAVLRRPLVATFHGPWALEASAAGEQPAARWATGLRRAIERLVYRRAQVCIAMSGAFADMLVSDYGVPRARIQLVPLGIDAAHFPLHERSHARALLGLPDGATVVSVRRLVPRVGLDLAIRALAGIPAHERPQLVIGGSGPERPRLEALARSAGVADRVSFFGYVPDDQLALFYAAGDVCVVPSRELEGFGYGALEALAAGTPVVAVSTGGLVDLIGALEPRWLVPWDAAALAATLSDVLREPDDFPSRGACRAYAARFDWPAIAAQTLAAFDRAAGPAMMRR